MADTKSTPAVKKFAGIEVPPELSKANFFFMFFSTFLIGILMTATSVLQPPFLLEIVKIDDKFEGSINSFLQIMSQVATLLFIGYIGIMSDKTGRRILAVLGFAFLVLAIYLLKISTAIAEAINISPETAASICSWLSLMPNTAPEWVPFAPGLLVSYVMRFLVGVGFILVYPQFITMVGDYTYDKDRGKGMALNGMMMGVAAILVFGIFGAIMKQRGVPAGFTTAMLFAALGAVLTFIFVKDRMPEKPKEKQGIKDVLPVLKKSTALKTAYVCSLITRADIVVLATYLLTWGTSYGISTGLTKGAAMFKATFPMMVMGVITFLVFPVIAVMLDKWGRMQTIIVTVLCASLGMLVMGTAPDPYSAICYIAAVFAGVGMAGSIAGANTLALDVAPITQMGAVMAGMNTMQPIGVLFFLILGGYLFDIVAPQAAFILKGGANLLLFLGLLAVRSAVSKEITPAFTMDWEPAAKQQMMKIPGSVRQGAIEGAEAYAKDQNVTKITAEFCQELRKMMGQG